MVCGARRVVHVRVYVDDIPNSASCTLFTFTLSMSQMIQRDLEMHVSEEAIFPEGRLQTKCYHQNKTKFTPFLSFPPIFIPSVLQR